MAATIRIVNLVRDQPDLIEQAALLLQETFRARSRHWQDRESARAEVFESLHEDRISRVALDEADRVVGWIGAVPMYDGIVWEIHPLAIAVSARRRGIGRALAEDLEAIVPGKPDILLAKRVGQATL